MKYIGSKHQRENKQNSDNMHNVQDYSVLYNNAVRPFICEGWHISYLWHFIILVI